MGTQVARGNIKVSCGIVRVPWVGWWYLGEVGVPWVGLRHLVVAWGTMHGGGVSCGGYW